MIFSMSDFSRFISAEKLAGDNKAARPEIIFKEILLKLNWFKVEYGSRD